MTDHAKPSELNPSPSILVACAHLLLVLLGAALGAASGGDCEYRDRCKDNGGDSDYDGYCADWDLCPWGNDDDDRDQDGIPDACDLCPDYPGEDEDEDGVCDAVDLCPGADDRIDESEDGIPDCYAQCLLGFCPSPGEVYNGDFEDGLEGWRWVPVGNFFYEPSVRQDVDDATALMLNPQPSVLDFCGWTEAIGLMAVPRIHGNDSWSLRLRYQLHTYGSSYRYCDSSYCPFEITISRGDAHHSWAFLEATAGWASLNLCVPAEYGGRRASLRLASRLGESYSRNCIPDHFVYVDDLELTQDSTDCLAPDP